MQATQSQITTGARVFAGPPLHPVAHGTLPRLFFGAIERFDHASAMQVKRNGAWQSLSHRDLEQRVSQLAAALHASGVGRGDRVALLSENRPEWAITDYATLCLGAQDVPIYVTLPANQIEYILRDSAARAIFVSTREQLAKIEQIRGNLPELQQIVCFDDPGTVAGVERWEDVLAGGQRVLDSGGFDLRERAGAVQPDDVATLIYTSGTTGDPKGVMLTQFNIASNVAACRQHGVLRSEPGQVALSFLPLSHIFERTADYYYWDGGVSIAYAESIEKVADNMGEVRPHLMVAVPRLYDKIYGKVTGATGIKKKLVDWALRVGMAAADEQLAGRTPRGALGFQYRLADRLVFSKLRARTGGRIHTFVSGGAPLSAQVAKFFFAAGLPVFEGYGLTETSPVISANRPDAVKLGSVGQVVPGVEVMIGEDGEILARGPNVMKGYYNRPDATSEAVDANGWFHTGDVGEVDGDGFLRITDRIKNLIVTAGGKNVAPAPIENEVAMSPFVLQALMLGDQRPYPILLLVPDFENLEAWARTQAIAATDRKALLSDARIRQQLERDAMARVANYARYERPKKVVLIPLEFTIDDGLLTPKMSIKRKAVEARYRAEIEAAYAEPAPADG